MNNRLFFITLDPQTGTVSRISHPEDPDFMNWCGETGAWGSIHHRILRNGFKPDPLELVEFQQRGGAAVRYYRTAITHKPISVHNLGKQVSCSHIVGEGDRRETGFILGSSRRIKIFVICNVSFIKFLKVSLCEKSFKICVGKVEDSAVVVNVDYCAFIERQFVTVKIIFGHIVSDRESDVCPDHIVSEDSVVSEIIFISADSGFFLLDKHLTVLFGSQMSRVC